MKGKTVVILGSVGLVLAALGSGRQAGGGGAVEDKGPGKQLWEFKVVWSRFPDSLERAVGKDVTPEKAGEEVEKAIAERTTGLTRQYNELAADGWEYVGILQAVAKNPVAPGPRVYSTGAFLLFKRLKPG